mgnify:FL=1
MPASHCLWLTAVYEAINMLQSYFELCQNIDSKVTIQTPVSVWLVCSRRTKGYLQKKQKGTIWRLFNIQQ